MALVDLVDSVRSLILSYSAEDDATFRRGVDSIIRALVAQNRPAEAKSLRDALKSLDARPPKRLVKGGASLQVLSQRSSGLISFPDRQSLSDMVFDLETQSTLDEVIREHGCSAKLAESGMSPRNRLLFWGPPGCGKTAAAGWLAQELGMPCGVVRLGSLITSYVGETGANIDKVLRTAEETPMVLLIDEADAIAKSREDENDVGELRRVVNSLLQGLDSFSGRESILVLASNHSSTFDEAVWRRFDAILQFPLPGPKERLTLLKKLTSGVKVRGSLSELAKKLSGTSFAEIERAVIDVARKLVVNNRKTATTADILECLKEWKQRTSAAARKRARRK